MKMNRIFLHAMSFPHRGPAFWRAPQAGGKKGAERARFLERAARRKYNLIIPQAGKKVNGSPPLNFPLVDITVRRGEL